MKKRLFLATLLLYTTSSLAALSPQERDAMGEVDKALNKIWKVCRNQTTGEDLLFIKAVVPERPQSFAEVLIPESALKPGATAGFYQFPKKFRLEHGPIILSEADRRNGIQARYYAKIYFETYRIYDGRSKHWGQWQNSSTGSGVYFANVTVTLTNNDWETTPEYYIMTNAILTSPTCNEIPAG